jgi:polysaccharide chain length determinant protein (PEP-CTERM system associated)
MEEHVLTPQECFAILNRRKWLIIIPFCCIAIVAGLVAWQMPAIYMSKATVMIEQREIPAQYVVSSQTSYAEQRMQNIKQRTLTSRQLQELIKEYNLYMEDRGNRTIDEILAKMRKNITLKPIHVNLAGRGGTATIAFTLSYEGKNPKKIQKVTDRIVTLFLKEDLKERTDQSSSTLEFLRKEMVKLKTQLAEAEERMAGFKKQHADSLPELYQFNMQTVSSVDLTTAQARETLRTLKEKKEELEEQLANTTVDLETEMLGQIRENEDEKRLALLKMELINLKTQFSDLYPDVKKLQHEIDDLTLTIEQRKMKDKAATTSMPEVKEVVRNPAHVTLSAKLASLKSDIRSAQNQIRNLDKKKEEYRGRLAAAPDVEAEYNEIVTERTNLTGKYKEMQAKMMEAKVAHALESQQKGERFTLIESATLPEKPFKPNRMAIVMIGFVLALGAGVGLAAIAEFADDSVRDPLALERISGFPVLTSIPFIVTREERVKAFKLRIGGVATAVTAMVIVVFLFDAYVMDLNIFISKVIRKLS